MQRRYGPVDVLLRLTFVWRGEVTTIDSPLPNPPVTPATPRRRAAPRTPGTPAPPRARTPRTPRKPPWTGRRRGTPKGVYLGTWRRPGLHAAQVNAVYGSRDRQDRINRRISKETNQGSRGDGRRLRCAPHFVTSRWGWLHSQIPGNDGRGGKCRRSAGTNRAWFIIYFLCMFCFGLELSYSPRLSLIWVEVTVLGLLVLSPISSPILWWFGLRVLRWAVSFEFHSWILTDWFFFIIAAPVRNARGCVGCLA